MRTQTMGYEFDTILDLLEDYGPVMARRFLKQMYGLERTATHWQLPVLQIMLTQLESAIAGVEQHVPERWWHLKVAGYPTRYERECIAYSITQGKRWDLAVRGWAVGLHGERLVKQFTREFLGEPIPPEKITKTVIPRARSCGKSEDIKRTIP